jgi:multidrug transporter EmrE-like cation transporter
MGADGQNSMDPPMKGRRRMAIGGTAGWLTLIFLSVLADVGATIYLKVSGDRIDGMGFFLAAVIGVAVFAPSIVLIGYALKAGPPYVATIGIWAVGVYAMNTVAGVVVFRDPFTARVALGMAMACVTVVLLKPA